MLGAGTVLAQIFLGPAGVIEVWMIAIINVGIFFAAMGVYSIAVLVQYGFGGEKS
jgi:hypothetical protein